MNESTLSTLFVEFPFSYDLTGKADPIVKKVTSDSRQVIPGALFVAFVGENSDGHKYIESAVLNGACAVVGEKRIDNLTVPYIRVENARRSLAYLAAAFYGYPARKLTMIGVTGTDGKTTTSNLLYNIMVAAGLRTGLISTVNAVIGSEVLDTGFHVTTPDAPDVQKYLAKMVDAGLTHVVLETTSHGWAQYRVDACEFDIGIVTNITHEHLDYHGSYENYRNAKSRLFTSLSETLPKSIGNIRLSVLNCDDISFPFLDSLAVSQKIIYGLSGNSDIRAENIIQTKFGINFQLVGKNIDLPIITGLYGRYNVYNCLAAMSAAIYGLGIHPEICKKGLAKMQGVPGRMQNVVLGQDFTAFVDFAHTPNALKVTLQTARELLNDNARAENGRLFRVIAVFGSAGLRDKEKRRMMAEISAQYADITILTAEDPRTESLDDILNEMASGAEFNGAKENISFYKIPDRGDAIRFAVKIAAPGDIVIACGKGHEQSMCFGSTEYHWDDVTAMTIALSEKLGLFADEMPYLPTRNEK